MIIATSIIADQPTALGNIYPREVLENIILDFNIRASSSGVNGGVLDRTHIQRVNEYTHSTKSLLLNESGVMCADIRFRKSGLGRDIEHAVNNGAKIIARPLMSVPNNVLDTYNDIGGHHMTHIYKIMNVHIEYGEIDE